MKIDQKVKEQHINKSPELLIDDILARLPLKTRTVIVDQMPSSYSETSKNLPNYDQFVCQSLIDHFKKQKTKNSASFHKLLYELFDEYIYAYDQQIKTRYLKHYH